MQRQMLKRRKCYAALSLTVLRRFYLIVGAFILGLFVFDCGIYAKSGSNDLRAEAYVNKPSAMNTVNIKGRVVDTNGTPIIGATIKEVSITNGTITDLDGNFTLDVSKGASIEVSYIGYKSQTISISNNNNIVVTLLEDTKVLDEVVVVGYGTQKKVNLTGSVASLSADELADRPVVNTTNLLQGKVNGLEMVSNNAQPGRDDSSLTLRGKGSFSTDTSPLVLIDGVVGNMSELAPGDIESVSVLKDAASASIYGSRAANGVVLVTTKKGKAGKNTVSYNFNYGIQEATRLSDQIWDSSTYMELYNQMADRMVAHKKYPQEIIDKYKDPNRNKLLYPDYNWMEETFNTGHVLSHNLGINGGSDKLSYNISLGYTDQSGLLDNHNYSKYTGLINLSSAVNDRIKISASVNLYNSALNEPYYTNESLVLFIAQSRPMTMPYLPDGSGRYSYSSLPQTIAGDWQNRNPVWAMNETSRNEESWRANSQLNLDVDFIKKEKMKLSWSTKGAIRYTDFFRKEHYPANSKGYYYLKESDYMENGADDYMYANNFFPEKRVTNRDERSVYTSLSSLLNFNWDITEKHVLGAMMGVQEEGSNLRYLYAYRENYPSDSMTEIDGGATLGQNVAGGISEYAIRSLFGRVNYAYNNKYLFEANFRYDGTSRIHPDYRWGFFPSFSGAWRVSEENFIKDNNTWIDNLKLRASYGMLGNSSIENYPYQEVYNSTAYIFGNNVSQGVTQTAFKDKSLQWETTTVTDFGVDFSIFSGLFSMTLDYYNKVTDNILSQAAIPMSAGMSAPTINYGKLKNYGVEFEVGHQNSVGDFSYGVNFMASLNKNEVLELRAPSYGSYIYEVGKPYGEHYMYVWDGIFQSDKDIANSPKHPFNPKPGDIKFKDLNNDNVIDQNDRTMVEGKYPKMIYSSRIFASYKNLDVSLFFQGVEGRKIYTDGFGVVPFAQGASPTKEYLNAWTPDNTDTNVPALYDWSYAPMKQRSTFNLKDASYLRLKNLVIGYNLPKSLFSRLGVEFARVYFSGENLFVITDYPDYDPERSNDGWHAMYPQAKTYSLGVNLRF